MMAAVPLVKLQALVQQILAQSSPRDSKTVKYKLLNIFFPREESKDLTDKSPYARAKKKNLEEAYFRGAFHLLARASKLCYALGFWLVIAVVLIVVLSLSGLMPQLVSPVGIFSFTLDPSCTC